MFTKIDKKILITTIILLILVLVVGFVFYKYLVNGGSKIETFTNPKVNIKKTPEQKSDIKFQNQGVEIQGTGKGTLTVCLDKCGDGICQKKDPDCKEGDLNCICAETHSDCPQDCK